MLDRIRWHLFPEIRIGGRQGSLFGDSGQLPDSDTIPLLPDIMKVMDMQQEQLARSLETGHRVIHGVAGSGKTWLRLVTGMVDPESDSLLLLYDDAQSIYSKHKQIDFSLSSVGINARGRTTILKLNYRNTDEIFRFADQRETDDPA